jgi:hypothetical protein
MYGKICVNAIGSVILTVHSTDVGNANIIFRSSRNAEADGVLTTQLDQWQRGSLCLGDSLAFQRILWQKQSSLIRVRAGHGK